jgi:hypothetical protein
MPAGRLELFLRFWFVPKVGETTLSTRNCPHTPMSMILAESVAYLSITNRLGLTFDEKFIPDSDSSSTMSGLTTAVGFWGLRVVVSITATRLIVYLGFGPRWCK